MGGFYPHIILLMMEHNRPIILAGQRRVRASVSEASVHHFLP